MTAPVDREALIDLMARALARVEPAFRWSIAAGNAKEAYRSWSWTILAAIEAAGRAVAPVVPTQEMTRADDAVTCAADPYAPLTGEAWRAMLAASPFRKETP